jgi:bacterial/archaeal transporter family-2 protein
MHYPETILAALFSMVALEYTVAHWMPLRIGGCLTEGRTFMGFLFCVLIAFAAGCGLSVQAGVNASLGSESGRPVWSTLASFVIGAAFLLPFTIVPRLDWPTMQQLSAIRWWAWTGGLIGAAYVLSTILLSPRLGATVFFGIVIAGQILMALILDHNGYLGFHRHPVNAMRLAGGLLIIAGVFVVHRF